MPEESIRILMLEDHALLRGALAKTLNAEPDLQIVGECASVDESLAFIAQNKVDLVLLDINLGTEQGTSFMTRAKAAGYTGKVLVVTAGVGEREAAWLLSRGCSGIFLKNEPVTTLIEQVRNVVLHQAEPDQSAIAEPLETAAQGLRKPLTPRERKVLRHICEGLANKEIAEQIGSSEHSVKSFVQQLFAKTGARSRAQLVTFAIEEYWDQLDQP